MTLPLQTTKQPLSVDSTPRANRGWYWVAAFVVAGTLYRLTMAPGLLWGDSGEAQFHTLLPGWLVADQIVRSHVLYYALSTTLAKLPSHDAASAANTVAVIGGAFTIANLAWILSTICAKRIAIFVGTLLLLFAHTYWQLCTHAEMLSLTTALLTTEAIALIKLIETKKLRWLAMLAFANGLGLSNHNFALLMWPVYAFLSIRFVRGCLKNRDPASTSFLKPNLVFKAFVLAIVFLLIGMLPVIALSIEYYQTHGGVLRTTVKSFLVGEYGREVTNFSHLRHLFLFGSAAIALNFPTPLLLFAPLGAIAAKRQLSPTLFWYFLGTAIVVGGFGIRYEVFDQHTFLIPFFVYLSVFIAIGIDGLFSKPRTRTTTVLVVICAFCAPVVYAAAPPIIRAIDPNLGPMPKRPFPYRDRLNWFLQPWRQGYTGPEQFARETLAVLPQNAILVVDSSIWPPLNYLQLAENLRTDVHLDSFVAHQDWLPTITDEDRVRALHEGRLFATSDLIIYHPCWLRQLKVRYEKFGLVFQALPQDENGK